jgi:hypothetical protein
MFVSCLLDFPLNVSAADRRQRPSMASIRSRYSWLLLNRVRQKLPGHSSPKGSATSAAPVSQAITCCVCNASRAVSSVGSARASSRALVCSDCASQHRCQGLQSYSYGVHFRLLGRKRTARGLRESATSRTWVLGAKPKAHGLAHNRRAARNFATSSRK